MSKKLWRVSHDKFVTDHIGTGVSIVEASSYDEALRKFNALAEKRRSYPFMWSYARSIEEVEVIR